MATIEITEYDLWRIEWADDVCRGEGTGYDITDLIFRIREALNKDENWLTPELRNKFESEYRADNAVGG